MAKKKRSKKKIIMWAIVVIIFLIILSNIFKGKKEQVITVQTEKVTLRDITELVTATGRINPVYQVVITPEVTGEIVELPVKEGDVVKKGQLLIKIKSDIYVAQRDRAEANLKSAKSSLMVRKAQFDFIKSDFKRKKELYKKELINEQEMERIGSDLESFKAQCDVQKAVVLQAEAALKETKESLNKTTIYSPMNGTVSQLNVELGERVLGSGFSQGTNIMTVADLRKMEANVEVDENDIVLVSIGDIAKVEMDAFKNKTFVGVVTQIGNSARTRGRGTQEEIVNFEVKIALHDFDKKVRPGMSCNADIETETKNNVLAVPIQSVTARSPDEEEEKKRRGPVNFGKKKKKIKTKPQEVVFVVEENMAKKKEVKIGISDDTYLEIKEGLVKGEEVISGPYRAISRELKDEVKVTVNNKKDLSKKKGKK